jgi:hypothetical protein
MRERALPHLVPMSSPLVLGIVVAVVLIAARTRAAYPESRVVASVDVLLRVAREREGMGSALAR